MIHYQDRWAVVTGASSGLGRGLAGGLAGRGMSLVLTGRNEARLDETARQLPRLGRVILGPLLRATTQAWLADLARVVHDGPAAQATPAAR
jgi:NADP-dependent 3-hydroxy acid dehydrogenase YdfG